LTPITRLLDSDIIIDLEHLHPPALDWFVAAPAGSLALPGYVVLELYQEAPNKAQMAATEKIIRDLPVVWPAPPDCRQAVAYFRALHLSHGLGILDALIAATALSLSVPLCTSNLKHFRPVPGLVTEQPYPR